MASTIVLPPTITAISSTFTERLVSTREEFSSPSSVSPLGLRVDVNNNNDNNNNRARGLGSETKEEVGKRNQMTALRFETGGIASDIPRFPSLRMEC